MALGTLRVVAVDDHQLMLDAIRVTLEENEGLELVGEARSGAEALPLIGRVQPDLVLLDLRMPCMDGLVCLAQIRQRFPNVKVLVLSGTDEPAQISAALKQGACSFIVKRINPRDLASALRQAAEGTVFQTLGVDESTDDMAKEAGMTDSEVRVLQALAQGHSNRRIASELFIAEQTVKFHLTNIYRKLGVSNRTEAARHAYQRGLVMNPLYETA